MLAVKIGVFALAACALFLCLGNFVNADISCLDEQGEPVDWFIGYKFPPLKEYANDQFVDGMAYSYITSNDVEDQDDELSSKTDESESKIFIYKFRDLLLKYLGYKAPKKSPIKLERRGSKKADKSKQWVLSAYEISDPKSVLMRTLAPAFEKESSNISSVFYNDDPSDTKEPESDDEGESKESRNNNRRAHAKGVLLMDEESMNGVWLSHSVPKFPKIRQLELEYPETGVRYAQTFMCVSFKVAESAKKIVDHLVNMRVLVYEIQMSDKFYDLIPALKNLDVEEKIKGRRIPVKPKLSQLMTTRGGQVLQLFSKSIALDNDLYSGWIDEELGADLNVETWRNGQGGPMDSFCPKGQYHVNNIKLLKYDSDHQWSFFKDHSKWAISDLKDDGIVCIGDSNRMKSQFKRGGGAICLKCTTCWDIFSNTIQELEGCPVDNSKLPKSNQKDPNPKATLEKIREVLHL